MIIYPWLSAKFRLSKNYSLVLETDYWNIFKLAYIDLTKPNKGLSLDVSTISSLDLNLRSFGKDFSK
jgi:hypothetical protein